MNLPHRVLKLDMPHLLRSLLGMMACLLWLGLPTHASAQSSSAAADSREVTQQAQIWMDESGGTTIEQLATATPDLFKPIGQSRSFSLTADASLWMRIDLPATDNRERWYLQLSSSAALDRATLYQLSSSGTWKEQRAGDRIAVANWALPEQTPVFLVDREAATTVWLRLASFPANVTPRLQLLTQEAFDAQRRWSLLLLGGYFGFGILVLFLGIVHARLYGDRAFVAYSAYVTFMLFFQLAFTGIGGLYFWPNQPVWNNAAPALFVLLLSATGIWFVREAGGLARYSKVVDKATMAWVASVVMFSVIYTLHASKTTFAILNLFGLISVVLSMALCLWVWRRGERYGGWLFLGFLPVHLAYPFPALRSAGLIADNWLSQYAVVIGSAIEIPLLLYILHLRAKEFNENRARMRAIDHTDPLTGLAIAPVLTLRARDALRRSRRQGQAHTLMLVELANHAEIVQTEGRPIGDRALVVAASNLLSTVNELDTVCRVDDSRFAILIETPIDTSSTKLLAQKIIARGLAEVVDDRSEKPLRFRVVTAALDHTYSEPTASQDLDLERILAPLIAAMNRLADEPKKTIFHIPPGPASAVTVPVPNA